MIGQDTGGEEHIQVLDDIAAIFALADELHLELASVTPKLTDSQLEQAFAILLRETFVAGRPFKSNIAPMLDINMLRDACDEFLAKLRHQRAYTWAACVVRTLFVLSKRAGLDNAAVVACVSRIVALPAEEHFDGVGHVVLRASIDAVMNADRCLASEQGTPISLQDARLFMAVALVILRHDGRLPTNDAPVEVDVREDATANATVAPSGLRLAVDVASRILELSSSDNNRCDTEIAKARDEWRRDLHKEVIRLLRVGHEDVRRYFIVRLAVPLYHEWESTGSLQDLWFLISRDVHSVKGSVEIHLGLMCVLAEDLIHVLDLPMTDPQAFWDVLHLGISSKSDLCRRRGLHILQQLLSNAEAQASEAMDARAATSSEDGRPSCLGNDDRRGAMLCGEALVQWKDYLRVMNVLETETEMHLLDQVVATLARLCASLSAPTSYAIAPPTATEFRWIAVPLGILITTGTVARRRNFIFRMVTQDLRMGEGYSRNDSAAKQLSAEPSASLMDEAWIAQVFLPALDQVGWQSSTSAATLRAFSGAVTAFLRGYVRSLSVSRATTLLTILLSAVRTREIGSTGALLAILSAFDLGGAKMPAMGPDMLRQVKDTLLVVLPPLNQILRALKSVNAIPFDYSSNDVLDEPGPPWGREHCCGSLVLGRNRLQDTTVGFALDRKATGERILRAKRILLLDGVIQIVEAFTDYANSELGLSRLSLDTVDLAQDSPSGAVLHPAVGLLSVIPTDLLANRYRTRLASWMAHLAQQDGTELGRPRAAGRCVSLWVGCFARSVEESLQSGGKDPTEGSAAGRNLCRLGLLLSDGFSHEMDRDQVISIGLAPLVKILNKCWREPYVAGNSVRSALRLFAEWIAVSDAAEGGRWRMKSLEACLAEVVTFVTSRLVALMDAAQHPDPGDASWRDGQDAQTALRALRAAMRLIEVSNAGVADRDMLPPRAVHPGVVALCDRSSSLLAMCGAAPVSPSAHLVAVACLEASLCVGVSGVGLPESMGQEEHEPRCVFEVLPLTKARVVVRSLLEHNLEGRVRPPDGPGGQGSDQGWYHILRGHEVRKWSCLAELLPAVLQDAGGEHEVGQSLAVTVCGQIAEGIRASLRDEMPLAVRCFRCVFPYFMRSLPPAERSAEFQHFFQIVWNTFEEVRRPQTVLIRDLVGAVLHPLHLGMPELTSMADTAHEERESSLLTAFNCILAFGAANKPNVLRAVVERLMVLWKRSPGSMVSFLPGVVELLLFKDWGHGIESVSNDESSSSEAPRLMLLLFIETSAIPSALGGNEDSGQVLCMLARRLMDLQVSKEFRQASITDPVIYGRKLRGWQALCVLCGYFCSENLRVDDAALEVSTPRVMLDADVVFFYRLDNASPRPMVLTAILAWFWPVHGRTALPAVRHHMEIFAVRMCHAHPHLFVPPLVKHLSDVRLPGQVLCSLLIIAGHLIVGYECISSPTHRLRFFKACLPWMVGTHVMGRSIAQLVCHSLLPEVSVDLEGAHLSELFSFLHDNPDMAAMRERQLQAFGDTDCAAMCTVKGLLHHQGPNDEITPTHLCELLQKTMDEIWNEAQYDKKRTLEEGRAWLQTVAEVKEGTWFEEDGPITSDVDRHIQQKIIPWDKLDLALRSMQGASLKQCTAAGKRRQPVIMCAALIDKVPNLAGLARTSEIFAASSLVVPDIRVVKNPSFSRISTGAEQWLPIEELAEKKLLAWLRRRKRQGYTLVGVEQTNNSVCLTKVKFPRRCVLVLGREHSGLPLPLISEMDCCCQIPQQGVLRSLNAHVSGAMVIWEYTRQMLLASDQTTEQEAVATTDG